MSHLQAGLRRLGGGTRGDPGVHSSSRLLQGCALGDGCGGTGGGAVAGWELGLASNRRQSDRLSLGAA